ncbi:MAG: hypothetical protein AAF513_15215 [Pseudomonadota bacterium]
MQGHSTGSALTALLKWLVLSAGLALCAQQTCAQDYQPPRTPWGSPDLQGVWSNETLTPFERPANQADQAYVTEAQARAAAQRLAQRVAADASDRTGQATPPPAGGNVGAYNLGWMDFGTQVVSTRRSSLVIDPANGRVPVRAAALRARERAQRASFDDPEHMSVWDRCITRGMPGGMFPARYNNYYRILQTPDFMLIFYEMIHEARIIPMDGRPRLRGLRNWNGQPRGRWEGDTLLIETRGYNAKGWIATSGSQGRVKGIRHTDALQVVERFRRISDDTILWQTTIDDPEVYTTAWTVEIPMVSRAGSKIYEYACHEGNQAVGNILRGARVQAALNDS